MSVVVSLGILAAGLLPLALLRARSDAPSAPRRTVNRDALAALGRLQQERALTLPPATLPHGIASLDAYRARRARAHHPAGRGRYARSELA